MRLKSTSDFLVKQRQELIKRRMPVQSIVDRHGSLRATSIAVQKANLKLERMNVLLMCSRPRR